ncbi:carboxypeptidase regulatory-like domain-containing protein, partial [bacterium]|nr:carboxypeptidase regulatory-like domain-containing protein [bacterium]
MRSKKQLMYLIITCVALMALSGVCAYAANLVKDSSLESLTVGTTQTSGWQSGDWAFGLSPESGGSMEVVSDAHTGSKAVKLSRTSTAGDTAFGLWSTTDHYHMIPIVGGHRYVVRVWAKSPDAATLRFQVASFNNDATEAHPDGWIGDTVLYTNLSTQTKWTLYQMTYNAPANALYAGVSVRVINANTNLYIDDFSMEDTNAFAFNLFPDPSFDSFIAGNTYNATEVFVGMFRFFATVAGNGSMSVITPGHDSDTAVRLTRATTAGDVGFGMQSKYIDPRIPVIGGHSYRVSFWVKSDVSSDMLWTISSYPATGAATHTNYTYTTSTTWAQFSGTYTALSDAALWNIGFRPNTVRSIDIDDVSVVDVTPSVFTGTVTNGLSGQPISGAAVKVSSATQTFTTTTDSNGVYTFNGIAAGMWNLSVSSNGYTAWHSASNPSEYDIALLGTITKDVPLMPDTSAGSNSWAITDTFTRAANTDLGHTEDSNAIPWVKTTGNTSSTINSDGKLLFDVGASACGASLGRGFTPADFDMSVDMSWDIYQVNSKWAGIAYRQASAGAYNQGYFLCCPYTDGDGNVTIELQYNGTKVGSATIQTSYMWGDNVALRVRAVGDRHTVWIGTNKVMDIIDSQKTSGGYMGLFCDKDNIVYWDNLNVASSSATMTQATPRIYFVDFGTVAWGHPANELYDIEHTVVCVQGLANREAPRVFVRYPAYIGANGEHFGADDNIWLARLTEPGGLCENWPVETMKSVGDLVDRFRSIIRGVIVYDDTTGVLSTSLAATTAAACENAIAVRKDTSAGSMYNFLTVTKGLPVLIDLSDKFTGTGTIWGTNGVASTGSKKCDAYIWAKVNYLDTGKCDPTVLSYTLDEYGLSHHNVAQVSQVANLDYAVQRKAFCFDLSMWGDETPVDDPNQPMGADLNTFKAILAACNIQTSQSKMIKLCGFPRYDCKYTNYSSSGGSHTPAQTEGEFVELLTQYNAYMEATAPMPMWVCNTSFYGGLKPILATRRYIQNPLPTYTDMVSRGLINASGNVVPGNYILIGLGDYDGPVWPLYQLGWYSQQTNSPIWDDPQRGQVYCSWGIDPNIVDRAYVALDYFYRNKSSKDYFMAWDSGAGYVDPAKLSGSRISGYGDARPMWQSHCRDYYRLFNQSITCAIDCSPRGTWSSSNWAIYTPFSGNGCGAWWDNTGQWLINNVPCNYMGEAFSNSYSTNIINYSSGVNFAWYQTCLWTPTRVRDLQNYGESLGNNHKFLDAYSFYYLMRYYMGGNNNYRAAWVGDTIPRIMAKGQTYPVTVTVRNDGWDTWTTSGSYGLAYAIVNSGAAVANSNYDAHGRFQLPSGTSVAPGQTVTFTVNVAAPSTNGNYDLYYDMSKDGTTWFHEANNIEWKKQIIVATNVTDVDSDG